MNARQINLNDKLANLARKSYNSDNNNNDNNNNNNNDNNNDNNNNINDNNNNNNGNDDNSTTNNSGNNIIVYPLRHHQYQCCSSCGHCNYHYWIESDKCQLIMSYQKTLVHCWDSNPSPCSCNDSQLIDPLYKDIFSIELAIDLISKQASAIQMSYQSVKI